MLMSACANGEWKKVDDEINLQPCLSFNSVCLSCLSAVMTSELFILKLTEFRLLSICVGVEKCFSVFKQKICGFEFLISRDFH